MNCEVSDASARLHLSVYNLYRCLELSLGLRLWV